MRGKFIDSFNNRPDVVAPNVVLRQGASWRWQILMLGMLCGLLVSLVALLDKLSVWAVHRVEILLTLGGIGCWRWSWWLIQLARAVIYRYYVFPRLRRKATAAEATKGPVPEVSVLVATYKEKPWITALVFESIFRELNGLARLSHPPRVVAVTGCDADDLQIRQAYAKCCPPSPPQGWRPELILLRGDKGKRPALADGLREIARHHTDPEGVVVLMDGDTLMEPELLQKVLPIFRLTPPVAAVTTNENGLVHGPGWFAEWISLRFGLRHRTMCSVSLSEKLSCLTGRLSVFRASVACTPTFQAQIESDWIDHWLWGSFEMLSGDDKSTWYWLASRGHRMLYIPDAMATTIEVVHGSASRRALANLRRWSGNMMRNNWRVIALGPRKLGLFLWWCTVDQRIGMWTTLIGPIGAMLAFCSRRYDVAAGYLLWVLVTRVGLAATAWRHGRRWSACYIPLLVISEWAKSLVQIWVSFHPAKQIWQNRGGRTLDSTSASAFHCLRRGFAFYLFGLACGVLVLFVGNLLGFVPLWREGPLFLNSKIQPVAFIQAVIGQVAADVARARLVVDNPRNAPPRADATNGFSAQVLAPALARWDPHGED